MDDTLNSVIDSFNDSEKRLKQAVADVKLLRAALSAAYREINEICARTGSPRNQLGLAMVDEDYFLVVVDKARNTLAATDRPEYREEG